MSTERKSGRAVAVALAIVVLGSGGFAAQRGMQVSEARQVLEAARSEGSGS